MNRETVDACVFRSRTFREKNTYLVCSKIANVICLKKKEKLPGLFKNCECDLFKKKIKTAWFVQKLRM